MNPVYVGRKACARSTGRGRARSGVIVNLDALVTAREAEAHPGLQRYRVTRHLIYTWRSLGKIEPVDRRGRSPLYRFGDILLAERDTRRSGASHRGPRAA